MRPSDADGNDRLSRLRGIPLDGSTVRVTPDAHDPAAMPGQPVHVLVVEQGDEPGRRILLGSSPVRVGRLPPADVVLSDPRVSRLHAALSMVAAGVEVKDLGSTNGTFVDGRRINEPTLLPAGASLRIGNHVLKLELRAPRELQQTHDLEQDLDRARGYVQSLLPAPLVTGPVRADWLLEPSSRLGGDALGYQWLDERHFALFLLDVSGHGVGAAMHSVSVLNVLRQHALGDAETRDPSAVLRRLNAMFQMDSHGGMYLTMWYAVYDVQSRRLAFASAGHHPAFLQAGATLRALEARNLMLGALENTQYATCVVDVPAGARLHLFSDGAFEITAKTGEQRGLSDFVELLAQPSEYANASPRQLYEAVLAQSRDIPLEDDFSLLTVTFL